MRVNTMLSHSRILAWCYFFLVISVMVMQKDARQPTNGPVQECVNEAYQYWLKTMMKKYIRYADMTFAMSSSRRLFDTFLTQKMNSSVIKDYCREHRYARANFNRCDVSIYKNLVISNFGLADYICIVRVGDYAQSLPCLRDSYDWATILCRSQCSQFEDGSKAFLGTPTDAATDTMRYMADDCRYLTCMVACRYPILSEECGKEAATLDADALFVTFSSSWNLYEPQELRDLVNGGFQSPFPTECRELATGRAISDFISVSPEKESDATAPPKGPSRRVRMLLAVSTSSLLNDSLMCHFGNRIHHFFTSYCPSGFNQVDETDFVSLAITMS